MYSMQRQRRETAPERGEGSFMGGPESVEKVSGDDWNMGEAFKSEKQKRVIWSSKHIFVSLNLMIYCTLSASIVEGSIVVPLFESGDICPLLPVLLPPVMFILHPKCSRTITEKKPRNSHANIPRYVYNRRNCFQDLL